MTNLIHTKDPEFIRLFRRFRDISQNEGLATMIQKASDKIGVYLNVNKQRQRFRTRSFSIFGRHLPYFIHPYNATWRNERCVEIAVASYFLDQWASSSVLELGNVMGYYRRHNHMVVDKFEASPQVINTDFLDLKIDEVDQPEAFISISTLEHIGWDEGTKQDPDKVRLCIERIPQLVKDPRKILVSFPLGYHDGLDELVRTNSLPFTMQTCLVRSDLNQTWQELPPSEGLKPFYRYGAKFPGANACFFGLGIKKDPQ